MRVLTSWKWYVTSLPCHSHFITPNIHCKRLAMANVPPQLLISPPTNPRHAVHTQALTMAQEYEHTLRARLVRMSMVNEGLYIKAPRSGGGGGGSGHGHSQSQSQSQSHGHHSSGGQPLGSQHPMSAAPMAEPFAPSA